jgi:two-component system response regulator AtoC
MKRSSLTSGKESILVVDDDPGVLSYTKALLEMGHYKVDTANSGVEAAERLQNGAKPDLMLVDMAMPEMDGMRTIEACRRIRPDQKIVVLSCMSTPSTVVEAVRLGAMDYMTKPFYKADLDIKMDRWLTPSVPAPAVDGASCETIDGDVFFVAASPAMKKIRAQISQLAKVDVPVLLLGESGVGKEVLARLIHKLSSRARRPLVKVNCAAIPADLLESELFGYEAGAFTGAVRSKPGKFELCDQGTILLDEIGEMSPQLQAKLLHVLQDGQFSRLGGRSSIVVDFRVLAATNINVHEAIQNGSFRADLFYRLNAFTVETPPLRERRQEIEILIQHFLHEFSIKYSLQVPQHSPRLMEACLAYQWPGNLRELGNFVKRFLVLQDENLAISELEDKSRELGQPPASDYMKASPHISTGLKSLVRNLKHSAELKFIEQALLATNWNRKMAAFQLKISCKALRYKIKQYQISPPPVLRNSDGQLRAIRGSHG